MPQLPSNAAKTALSISIIGQNLIFHPVRVRDLMTVSETHPHHTSLLRLRAPIHAENTWNNQMCFLFFLFFYTSTNVQTYTIARTHTLTQTQARHSCHVILLGIMPTAKHVTYQKSL